MVIHINKPRLHGMGQPPLMFIPPTLCTHSSPWCQRRTHLHNNSGHSSSWECPLMAKWHHSTNVGNTSIYVCCILTLKCWIYLGNEQIDFADPHPELPTLCHPKISWYWIDIVLSYQHGAGILYPGMFCLHPISLTWHPHIYLWPQNVVVFLHFWKHSLQPQYVMC